MKFKNRYDTILAQYRKIIEDDNRMLSDQNKEIVRLKEELKHAKSLIGLYEACLTQGIKVDFPDVTGGKKGGNNLNGDVDFSDF